MFRFVIVVAVACMVFFSAIAGAASIELTSPMRCDVGEFVNFPLIVITATGNEIDGGPLWAALPFGFKFDESVRTLNLFGPAMDKVAPIASYVMSGTVLFIPVVDAFEPGESITIGGLRVIAGVESFGGLWLDVNNDFAPDAYSSVGISSAGGE